MNMAGKTAGVLKLFSLAVGVGAPAASFFAGGAFFQWAASDDHGGPKLGELAIADFSGETRNRGRIFESFRSAIHHYHP